MRCKNCGNAVRDDARFCPFCGNDLTEDGDNREIFSSSAEKRIDDECRQIEDENRKRETPVAYMSEKYYTDDYSDPMNNEEKYQTRVYNQADVQRNENYAPYAPEDIDEYGNEKKKKYSGLIVTLIICVTVIITAAVVAAALMLGKGCSGDDSVKSLSTEFSEPAAPTTSTVEQIDLPNVVGENGDDAADTLEKLGFTVSKIMQNSDTVDYGLVIEQSPRHGQAAEKGSVVTISVSLGPEQTTPPETETETETETEAESEPETETTASQSNKTISTYILPDSNSRYLDYEDLADISGDRLELARNEIYARHGRRFNSKELQSYFDRCTWYNGVISPDDFDESVLNKYERANVDFILQKENSVRN